MSVEDLNDFIVTLKKGGMSPNTVVHNVIIIAQFCKRNGRSGITRQVHLPERISSLPREYTQEELAKFLGACNDAEVALFSTFLLTGFSEQEVMYLGWPDVNLRLRTIRVTAKPDLGFFPKRWEEKGPSAGTLGQYSRSAPADERKRIHVSLTNWESRAEYDSSL